MTFSVLMIVVGIALIVRTLTAGGGALATGLILGLSVHRRGTRSDLPPSNAAVSPRLVHGQPAP